MSRPSDWSPLGWQCDPIPGDPLMVADSAAKYRSTATAVSAAIDNLRRLDLSNLKSLAFATSLDKIKEVAGKLDKVEARISGAAAALEYYGPKLDGAQLESLRALETAQAHAQNRRAYSQQVTELANAHNGSNDPAQRDALRERYLDACRKRDHEGEAVSSAKAQLARAIASRDEAAEATVRALDEIDQDSPIKDTWWDKTVDWFEKNVEPVLRKVFDALAEFADKWGWVLDLVGAFVTVLAAFVFGPVGWLVAGAIFAAISITLSMAKIGSAYYKMKDGGPPAVFGATVAGEAVSIGLSIFGVFAKGSFVAKLGAKPVAGALTKKAVQDSTKKVILTELRKKALKDAGTDLIQSLAVDAGKKSLIRRAEAFDARPQPRGHTYRQLRLSPCY